MPIVTRAACANVIHEHQERIVSLVGLYMDTCGEIEPDQVGLEEHAERHAKLIKLAQAMADEHEWFLDNCRKLKALREA